MAGPPCCFGSPAAEGKPCLPRSVAGVLDTCSAAAPSALAFSTNECKKLQNLTMRWHWGWCAGPQTDPDYFHPDDMADFYATPYKVHHNS
jgi:hypothetical protein